MSTYLCYAAESRDGENKRGRTYVCRGGGYGDLWHPGRQICVYRDGSLRVWSPARRRICFHRGDGGLPVWIRVRRRICFHRGDGGLPVWIRVRRRICVHRGDGFRLWGHVKTQIGDHCGRDLYVRRYGRKRIGVGCGEKTLGRHKVELVWSWSENSYTSGALKVYVADGGGEYYRGEMARLVNFGAIGRKSRLRICLSFAWGSVRRQGGVKGS